MRAVIQRVTNSKVDVDGKTIGEIGKGLLVFLGVGLEDDQSDVKYLAEKIVNLRIFEDDEEKMNDSLIDIEGEILVVSQFTLQGDVKKGRRPNFGGAAKPDLAKPLYLDFIEECKSYEKIRKIATGEFGADMQIDLTNDGPVTILLDSKKEF